MCVRYACCSWPTLGSSTSSASGVDSTTEDARGCTESFLPDFLYTVRTAAKGLDQLMSSSCRTTTTWRLFRFTSFFSMEASVSAPAQVEVRVADSSVSPQLHGRLASTITPFCQTEPSRALHCHVESDGCGSHCHSSEHDSPQTADLIA